MKLLPPSSNAPVRNTRVSRGLRSLGVLAAGPGAAVVVTVAVGIWLVAYAAVGFPQWMAVALQTVAAAVMLVMVFVIQHAQRRSETAMQLKLDALIHASAADDGFAQIEHAVGDELEDRRGGLQGAAR